MERNEYLQRPLIKDVVYQISDNMIQITSPCTSFINVRKKEHIFFLEVKQLFQRLQKEAKDSGKTKIKGSSKFLSTVSSLYPAYYEAVEKINKNISEINEIAHKIQSDGLHYGCCDDELLIAALEKQHEIEKFYHRNSPYSQYLECYHRIQEELTAKQWKDANTTSYVITLI